jgi:hypothetical protein
VNEPTVETQDVIDESTVDGDATVTRRGVRWYHVVVLGVAVLVCAAGVGFFVSQSSDRDDATNARKAAQAALTTQRASTNQSRTDLATDRSQAKTALATVAPLTTALHELSDLSNQEIDVVNQIHQTLVSNPYAVDQYNALADQGNALITQLSAKGQEVETLAEQLRQDSQFHTAAFVR